MLEAIKKLLSRFNGYLPKNPLKLVSIERKRYKCVDVCYQVSGKAVTLTDSPKNLVQELVLLAGFSKNDSERIHDAFIKDKELPEFRIVRVIFEKDGVFFEVEDSNSICKKLYTASEVFEDIELYSKFSNSDLYMIYWQEKSMIAAEERKFLRTHKGRSTKSNIVHIQGNRHG